MLNEALANSAASGQKGADAELHRLRGELVRQLPRPDSSEAEESFRTALAIAREQGTRGYELRAATSLARLRLVHRGLRHPRPQRSKGASRSVGVSPPPTSPSSATDDPVHGHNVP